MSVEQTSINQLITDNIDIWTSTVKTKSASGRGSSKKRELYGVKKLRELILELAVRGKLVPQDPTDEPASVLLERIAEEKAQLVKDKIISRTKALPALLDEDTPNDLPKGWSMVRLGNLTSKLGSGSTPRGGKNVYTTEGIPFLRSQNVRNEGIKLDDIAYIPVEVHQKMDKTKVIPSDVLLNITGASLGRSTVFPESLVEANVSQHVTIIRLIERQMSQFVHLGILSPMVQRLVWGRQVGMAIEGLSKKVLEMFEFPVPPLKEQHRIVAKVDELMTLCDQLEQQTEACIEAHQVLVTTLLDTLTNSANAEDLMQNWQMVSEHFETLFTTEESIDQLKQTILQLAVMGKLVPQDPTDEPAVKLLERIAEEKALLIKEKKIKKQKALPPIAEDEKPFELPKGWEWCRVQDVAQFTTSGSRDWAKYYSDSGALFVTMGNLSRGNYQLRLDNLRYVQPPEGGEGSRTKLEAHDLLISITGDVGNLGLIPEDFGEAYINQHTCLLRFMFECQDKYFPDFMRSPLAKYQFDAPQRGIKNSFRLSDVGEMLLPLPPREERKRVAKKVEDLMIICEQLKACLKDSQTIQLHLTDAIIEQAV
ncbi:restriction endonuclease subunit S [Vibrio sp. 10N.261.51.F11]|uniref:restriction endonuclease subunit S n=1 Tax=Vibrio sp. 10N.261.51.F11 TaxID=3229678 RepID=UPI0035511CD7